MLDVEQCDDVAIIRMQRAGGNVLDQALLQRLSAALEFLRGTHPVVLTGYKSIFAVDTVPVDDADRAELRQALLDTFWRVATQPRPLVAAVNGDATNSGFALAAAADACVMSHGTLGRSQTPDVANPLDETVLEAVGRPGGGLAQAVLRAGEAFSAIEAEDVGLVRRSTSRATLVDEAVRWARALDHVSHDKDLGWACVAYSGT